MAKYKIAIITCILPLFSFAQLYYPPNSGNTWDTIPPSSLGYCSDSINALYDFLGQNDTKAFILLKDGKIVLEKYFSTFTVDSNWYWASAGKTLTSVLVGIAQQKGYLSLSDTTSKYLGQGWTSCTQAQEDKITIKHHLTMTTGLDDGVTNADCTQPSCLQYKADAGTRWAYHNAPYTLLDTIMEVATGTKMNLFMNTNVKQVTGMNGLYIKTGDNNVYYSTARSMARFGLLLLSKGIWSGTAVLADTAYYNHMINTSQSLNPSYGYLTWLNGKNAYMVPQTQVVFPGSLNKDAPNDMFAALGKNAQLINVIPSQNMVWIRMGNPPPGSSGLIAPTFNNDIWQRINRLVCTQSVTGITTLSVSISPNPVQDALYIKAPTTIAHLTVTNSIGAEAFNLQPGDKNIRVPLGDIPKGIYFVKLQLADGEVAYRRIIKQ